MKPGRQDVEQMMNALMAVLQSTERARRKGDASRLVMLSAIAAHPASSPKAISAELGFHPSSITRQIQMLERDGHVKVSPDPMDGRSCHVDLAVSGQTELKRLREIGLQRWTSFVAKWDADDVRTLARLLAKLEQSKQETKSNATLPGARWRRQQKD
jgi:DNA-binding MarR family transcriptional regulator